MAKKQYGLGHTRLTVPGRPDLTNKTAVVMVGDKTLEEALEEGGGGTSDYTDLENKPSINGVELSGNKTSSDLGVATSQQGVKADTAYQKPQTGIPESDLSSGVQQALQKHFKGWWPDLATLKAAHTATAGDSAYVKDASPATTWSIYVYDSTASSDNYWADSGTDADTSNVQTFASGEEVNEVHIVNDLNTGGVYDVLSAEQGKVLNTKKVSQENDSENCFSIIDGQGNAIAKINNGFEITSDGDIRIKNGFVSSSQNYYGRTVLPQINYTKTNFRWLDIGNSHSFCSLQYLNYIAKSQGVDLSNVAFCRVLRGSSTFDSWVKGYHDQDISGEGDDLTGGMYYLCQDFGGLNVVVTGNKYTEPNGTPVYISETSLTQSQIGFWGGDCSIFRSLLNDNDWDLITIHQRYIFNEKYDESKGWAEDLLSGDYTDSGGVKEFIRILKTTNPQSCIGFLYALTPFGYNGNTTIYDADSLNVTNETHNRWCKTIKRFLNDSGVDFIIPAETALENLRNSSVPNVKNEWDLSGPVLDVVDRFGFNYDYSHTASAGVAPYTMAAVAWECVFAPRFGKSIYGNGLRELTENDINTTKKYLQPSYNNNGIEVIIDDNNGNPWNKPLWSGISRENESDPFTYGTRATSTVRLTDANRTVCQIAAILAVNDMWKINNPDNIII